MAVSQALRSVPGILREQPVLFVPLAIFALLQVPQFFVQWLDPIVSILFSLVLTGVFLFVTPLFYAGTIGMANDAAAGERTSMSRFWLHARENYASVLAAYLLVSVFGFAFSIVFGVIAFVVAVTIGIQPDNLLVIGIAALVGLVLIAAYLVVMFALHFYPHAIVVDGTGAIDGLKRSVSVVRHNLKAVVGYGLVSIVLGALMGAVYVGVSFLAFPSSSMPGETPPQPDLLTAALGVVTASLAMTIFATALAVFSVAFYRAITGLNDVNAPSDVGGAPANATSLVD